MILASDKLYRLCDRCIPCFGLFTIILLAFAWIWGFGFAPAERLQGDSFRILYIHVPAAIWSMAIYLCMAIAALVGLIKRNKLANQLVIAMAPIGAAFTFMALATGAVWGKPMWGTWWVWDARLTSELVLLFLYLGAIALYNAFDNRELAAKAAGILILVGVINLPIIHYSVEWWQTLHQNSTNMHNTVNPAMRPPLRIAIVGYLFLFLTLIFMRLRNIILISEINSPWVNVLIERREQKK